MLGQVPCRVDAFGVVLKGRVAISSFTLPSTNPAEIHNRHLKKRFVFFVLFKFIGKWQMFSFVKLYGDYARRGKRERMKCASCGQLASLREKRNHAVAFCGKDCQLAFYQAERSLVGGDVFDEDDGMPDEVLEQILLRMDPPTLLRSADTYARVARFVSDANFRLRYMQHRPEDIRRVMARLLADPGIMLAWMPQSISSGVWSPLMPSFYRAIRLGRLEPIRIILESGRINPGTSHSRSLTVAADSGQIRVLQLLLQDQRVKPEDPANRAMEAACMKGHEIALRVLLVDGRAQPNGWLNQGVNRYLQIAVEHNKPAILKLLLSDKRAKPQLENQALLFQAVLSNQIECVLVLLDDERVLPDWGMLAVAINHQYKALIDILLNDGRMSAVEGYIHMRLKWIDNVTGQFDPSFDREIERRFLEEQDVRDFLQRVEAEKRRQQQQRQLPIGGQLDKDDEDDGDKVPDEVFEQLLMKLPPEALARFAQKSTRALMFASDRAFRSKYMKVHVVEIRRIMGKLCVEPFIMLDWMQQAIEEHIWKPLANIQNAVTYGRTAVVAHILTDKNLLINKIVSTDLLDEASKGGHTEIMRMLLRDPRIDLKDNHSFALQVACERGHLAIAELLAQDDRTYSGIVVTGLLGIAAKKGHVDIVKLILDTPRLLARQHFAYAILEAALDNQSAQSLGLMLKVASFEEATDNSKSTPLIYAVQNRNVDVVRLLLEDGRNDPSKLSEYLIKDTSAAVLSLLLDDKRLTYIQRMRITDLALALERVNRLDPAFKQVLLTHPNAMPHIELR